MADNETANDSCLCRDLPENERLAEYELDDLDYIRRLRCLGHIINLAAKTILQVSTHLAAILRHHHVPYMTSPPPPPPQPPDRLPELPYMTDQGLEVVNDYINMMEVSPIYWSVTTCIPLAITIAAAATTAAA
ncbi:hypothetical protein OQA88_1054 [Cercophora sp. LCS_1]